MGNVTFVSPTGDRTVLAAEPGISIMQVATSSGLAGIDAECGGSLSCATCHVIVHPDWYEHVGAPGEAETGMLEFAESPTATSRLSCQIRYTDKLDGLVVTLPESQ